MHLIGPYVEVGTVGGGNLTEELFKALPQHLHALWRSHTEAERVVEEAAVPRHVNLRNHGYASLACVGYHIANLVVGVKLALVAPFALESGVVELRISLALYAPCRIVGEMPMENVKLILRKEVQFTLQHLHGTKVSTHIVHKATNGKSRPIAYAHLGI